MHTKALFWVRRSFWAVAIGVAVYAFSLSRAQFLAWHADALGAARLLPPYHGMGYFIQYAFVHFWLAYVLSSAVAWVFFAGAKWLNARRGGMLFELEEPYFIATGIFVSGHPAWIFYLLLVFTAYFLATLICALAYGPHTRVSFYYFWLPCAVLTVLLGAYLKQYAWYAQLLI